MATGTIIIRPLTASLTRDTDFFSRMDPYVKVTLGTRIQKGTVAKKAGKNPSWNDEITLRYSGEDIIKIEVWDKDRNSTDDLVASTSLSFSQIKTKGNKMNEWINLSHKGKSAGRLLVDVQFFPDGEINKVITKDQNNTATLPNNTHNNACVPSPGFTPPVGMVQPNAVPMTNLNQIPMKQPNQTPMNQQHYTQQHYAPQQPQPQPMMPQQFVQVPMYQLVNNIPQQHPQMYAPPIYTPPQQQHQQMMPQQGFQTTHQHKH